MLNRWLHNRFPYLRRAITRRWYEYISTLDTDANVLFMNYGYADLDPDAGRLDLPAEDEKHRYAVQLYHHVASAIDWAGRAALEIGAGRGGGACYILRRFGPKSIIGTDLAVRAMHFCNRYYSTPGLSFAVGDAGYLTFPDQSFDVVINVESSLYYPNVERFFSEVARVLKPNGYFLYADMRYLDEIDHWRAQLRRTRLQLLSEENITPNVIKALALDHDRKRKLIDQYAPRLLRKPFNEFAGMTGAGLAPDSSNRRLARGAPRVGERVYLNFVCRKPATWAGLASPQGLDAAS